MNKWIRGSAVFVLVAIFAHVGIAFAYNTTTQTLTSVPQAQYSQITSMKAELKKIAQNAEVCVAVTLYGQGIGECQARCRVGCIEYQRFC